MTSAWQLTGTMKGKVEAFKAKTTKCHHCKRTGHWKRECPLRKGGTRGTASSAEMNEAHINAAMERILRQMAYTQTRVRRREGGGWAQEMPHEAGMDQEENWMAELGCSGLRSRSNSQEAVKAKQVTLSNEPICPERPMEEQEIEFISQELQREWIKRKDPHERLDVLFITSAQRASGVDSCDRDFLNSSAV